MDWIRLGKSGRDLTGVGRRAGTLSVSPRQLAEHCTAEDAWIAIRGKVYNVTQYLPFHPGGRDELMKGAGKDATQLFNEVGSCPLGNQGRLLSSVVINNKRISCR